jgi:hypothetical protein
MTRMTPAMDRLAAARPETARRAAAFTDEGERQRLLAAIMADEQPQRSRRHRPIAFAAAAVTVAAGAAVAVTALAPARSWRPGPSANWPTGTFPSPSAS